MQKTISKCYCCCCWNNLYIHHYRFVVYLVLHRIYWIFPPKPSKETTTRVDSL